MGNQNLFEFLDKTINVLVIHADRSCNEFIKNQLEPIGVYNIKCSFTCIDALKLLRSGTRFHVCIMDLGINDVENDEFLVLKQYANHCSVIIYTGSNSPRKGALSIKYGAKDVFDMRDSKANTLFIPTVNKYALLNLVNFRYTETSGDTISLATKILFEKNPISVTEWADFLRLSDRQLRNLWATSSGFSAKNVLYIYTLYTNAFSYYSQGHNNIHESFENTSRKLFDYYTTHGEIIKFLIS